MVLHDDPSFKIYFGDSKDKCVNKHLEPKYDYFKYLLEKLDLDRLFFLENNKSMEGYCIKNKMSVDNITVWRDKGSYIITDQRSVGIGVLTADSIPLIIYDSKLHVISIVDLNWKLLISRLLATVIDKMRFCFGSNTADFTVYLGPSINLCCYKVSRKFIKNFDDCLYLDDILIRKNGDFYMDLPKLATLQMINKGVKVDRISLNYNSCTACDPRFYSNFGRSACYGLQPTIAILK